MSIAVRFVFACVATAATAAAASAQVVPTGCSEDPSYASAYERAHSLGRNLGSSVWGRMNDCTRLEPYVDRVAGGFRASRPKTQDLRLVCRYAGLVDGALEVIAEALRSCDVPCCQQGALVGELGAQLYCDFALLLGDTRRPDDFLRARSSPCTAGSQSCCEAAFDALSNSYALPSVGGTSGACLPYTQGASREAWSSARELSCAAQADGEL